MCRAASGDEHAAALGNEATLEGSGGGQLEGQLFLPQDDPGPLQRLVAAP